MKNLTLSLLKSVRPYDDTNPDWKDLMMEFKELDQYLVQCHGYVLVIMTSFTEQQPCINDIFCTF